MLTIILAVTSIIELAVIIILIIISRDKLKSAMRTKEYDFINGGDKCTIRLTREQARGVKSCVSRMAYEHTNSPLKFLPTKVIK